MKKIRITLSIAACLIALSGALATQLTTSITGYEFIPAGDDPAQCVDRGNICDPDGTVACRVNSSSPILREVSDPLVQCGKELKMRP